jgi:hypothetical protein
MRYTAFVLWCPVFPSRATRSDIKSLAYEIWVTRRGRQAHSAQQEIEKKTLNALSRFLLYLALLFAKRRPRARILHAHCCARLGPTAARNEPLET